MIGHVGRMTCCPPEARKTLSTVRTESQLPDRLPAGTSPKWLEFTPWYEVMAMCATHVNKSDNGQGARHQLSGGAVFQVMHPQTLCGLTIQTFFNP